MRSGFLAEKRVDAPAAVDPASNPGYFEALDDLDNVRPSHERS
jgi:hypothetical protein